jgi:adenylate cyclase
MSLQSTKDKQTVSSALERQFALEILKSDKLRVTILLGAWLGSFALAVCLFVLFSAQFQATFHGRFDQFWVRFLFIAFVTAAALFVERLAIARLIRKQQEGSPLLRYLSAFIETSIPTIGIIVSNHFLGSIYGLFTPAPTAFALFIVLSILRLDFKLCVFTGAVAALEYGAVAIYLIKTSAPAGIEPILGGIAPHLGKAGLMLLAGIVAGLVSVQIKKRILHSFAMAEERNRISRTFGEYVSPAVVDALLTLKPHLRSENKTVCVMFLDIRNFTGFAEKRSPAEVVEYLESLFEFMIEIINRHNGIINKFLGDGFMAVFGAPLSDGRDCANALEAAQEILDRLNRETKAGAILPTKVGIGLHAGEAVTGSIGSALRREYTVIGDVVNLAARIEKLNKEFDSQLLISEIVWQSLGKGFASATPMGQVQVRGREKTIQVYQVA